MRVRKYMLKLLIWVTLVTSGAAYGQEGFFMDGNLFYFQKEEERSNNAGTATNEYSTENLFLGLGICYRTGSLCFGGKYLRGEIGAKNSSGNCEKLLTPSGAFLHPLMEAHR